MVFNTLRKMTKLSLMTVSLSMLAGSLAVDPTSLLPQLDQVKAKETLTIVTRNNPVTFYEDRSGYAGYEYELAKAFADSLGVKLEIIVADTVDEIISTLEQNKADIGAAGLSQTLERKRRMRFSSPYKEVTTLVVYKRGNSKPSSPEDLVNSRILIPSQSSHAEKMQTWQQDLPALSWIESADVDVSDLLHMLANESLDYALVNSNEFRVLQSYYPSINVGFSIDEKRNIAWTFSKNSDESLSQAADDFLEDVKNSAFIAALDERYYGHFNSFDYVGAQRFLRQSNDKLEQYKIHFQQAAEKHDLDWRLLAAVGYQESHWNPKAKSFTGVRGLMMLTLNTAKELGIQNRLDPIQSIQGGAQYLANLHKRLNSVNEPDRTWMALAAYNVGYGHLQDARKITELTGGNPDLWMDVKESLPLLSQKQYYKFTRHGYARGQEPVDYVQNIRRYHDVLVWNDEQRKDYSSTSELLSSASITVVPPLL